MLTTHTFGASAVTWIDVIDPTVEELDGLARQYGLASRTFDEAYRRAARPMMRRYADHVYVVAFSGTLAEIDMYLGPTWLITVCRHDRDGREWDTRPVVELLDRHDDVSSPALTSGQLFATILDELIDGYFDTTDVLEDRLELVEDSIFTSELRTEQQLQHDLFDIRRHLLELRRAVIPLREVLSAILRREVQWIEGEALITCRDAFDKLLRAVDLVDEQRELVGNAVDAHLAVVSNQMNLVMKKLTAWGSIVFGATLIAGIYGMNFRHMPELDWKLGYPMALGMMAVLSVSLYRVFRRRDWL
ncbi:MAG TPA: magnesium transporter CorA family protein [Ilumatobacteraceae bacterium]|nr:magnesium transporter CorA family protein [Ilumatobacteraceae bacterium]